MGYLYVFLSVGFGVLSQLLVKWRMGILYNKAHIPDNTFNKMIYLIKNILLDPIIVFCIICTFMAGTTWMAAMTKLPISKAYPLTSLGYLLVLLLSCLLLNESFNAYKLAGSVFIMIGIIVASQG